MPILLIAVLAIPLAVIVAGVVWAIVDPPEGPGACEVQERERRG